MSALEKDLSKKFLRRAFLKSILRRIFMLGDLVSQREEIKEEIFQALKSRPINEGGPTLEQKYGFEVVSFVLKETRFGDKLVEATEEKKRREPIAEAENYAAVDFVMSAFSEVPKKDFSILKDPDILTDWQRRFEISGQTEPQEAWGKILEKELSSKDYAYLLSLLDDELTDVHVPEELDSLFKKVYRAHLKNLTDLQEPGIAVDHSMVTPNDYQAALAGEPGNFFKKALGDSRKPMIRHIEEAHSAFGKSEGRQSGVEPQQRIVIDEIISGKRDCLLIAISLTYSLSAEKVLLENDLVENRVQASRTPGRKAPEPDRRPDTRSEGTPEGPVRKGDQKAPAIHQAMSERSGPRSPSVAGRDLQGSRLQTHGNSKALYRLLQKKNRQEGRFARHRVGPESRISIRPCVQSRLEEKSCPRMGVFHSPGPGFPKGLATGKQVRTIRR